MTAYPQTVLIKPVGGACDMRCSYCFYYAEHAPTSKVMALETLRAFAATWTPRVPRPLIVWQGGEPTLWGLDRFDAADAIFGPTAEHSIQTSGIHLDRASWGLWLSDPMRRERYTVGVSIDGPPRHHDRARKDAQGRGTHARAASAVATLRGLGVRVAITCTARAGTSPKRIAQHLAGFGVPIRVLERIPEGPDDPDAEADAQAWRDILDEFERMMRAGWDGIVSPLSDLELMRLGYTPDDCRWRTSCDGYVVLDHDGAVYPCDHYVREEWRIAPGSGLDAASSPTRTRFAALKVSDALRPGCVACAARSVCRGGCPARSAEAISKAWCAWMQEHVQAASRA